MVKTKIGETVQPAYEEGQDCYQGEERSEHDHDTKLQRQLQVICTRACSQVDQNVQKHANSLSS